MNKRFYRSILALFLSLFIQAIQAQEKRTADELLILARKTAFEEKNYSEAINLCRLALRISPGYTDIEVFSGRLYFWSEQPDSARLLLSEALLKNPAHEDAALAAASIAYFTDHYTESLGYCNTGLQYHPASKELLLQKVKTLIAVRSYRDARQITDSLLKADPSASDVKALAGKLKDSKAVNKIGISYDYTHFAKQFDQGWHLVSIDYNRQTKAGSFIARVNYGNRFSTGAVQFEADAYPHIARNFYAYLNFGYSPGLPVFPRFRSGFSLYASLPKSFEADAGFRYLNFGNDTWIYTGSLGKYYKKFWFNLRAYLTPDDHRISQSLSFTTRYYPGGAEDYLSLSLGSGISPDDRSQAIQLNSNYKLLTKKIAASYRYSYHKMNIFSFSLAYANVEYQPKTNDSQVNAGIAYQRRF